MEGEGDQRVAAETALSMAEGQVRRLEYSDLDPAALLSLAAVAFRNRHC